MPLEFVEPVDRDLAGLPPRCCGCGYVLLNLETPRCPECGRDFDPQERGTFTRKVPFLFWRYWLPGLALAVACEFLIALIFLLNGSVGWGLAVGAPFALGAFLGYGLRAKIVLLVSLGITGVGMIGGLLIALHPSGMFCGLILALVFLAPVLVGVVGGAILRYQLKRTRFSQRSHLPGLLFLVVAPFGLHALERGLDLPRAAERVETRTEIDAPVKQVWDALLFYEEVRHEPPWILRIGLPRPVRTAGRIDSVGDRRMCIYESGRLTKRVTRHSTQHELAFDVTEQFRVQDHAVCLTRGSFMFAAIGARRTEVRLITEYEPLMTPRWCWRPWEQFAAHALHGHVLEGMRRACESRPPALSEFGRE